MVTVPEIITAMRDVIRGVEGVNACHYPAPQTIKLSREVVLYWDETPISMDLNQRMWIARIKGQVMTPLKGNTPAEFASIDNLITSVIDAFDTGSTTQVMPSLGGAVNRCQVVLVLPSRLIEYAGHSYYGGELFWEAKFHRRTP